MNIHRMVREVHLYWPVSFAKQMLSSARRRREMIE